MPKDVHPNRAGTLAKAVQVLLADALARYAGPVGVQRQPEVRDPVKLDRANTHVITVQYQGTFYEIFVKRRQIRRTRKPQLNAPVND